MTLQISLFCRPHQVPGGSPRTCVEVARRADAAGVYGIHFGEHLLMGESSEAYPYGPFPHDLTVPWLEPMTTLGAMAAVTSRIRLSTGVLLAPLRPAVLLAKSIATLDVISEGRAEIGVGVGWQKVEFDAAGVPWESRRARMYESIAACRRLWGQQPATFTSDSVSFTGVTALPVPIQERVPILFGVAVTAKSAPLIAELGDGWWPVGVDIDGVRSGVDRLRDAFSEIGRDPAELRVRVSLPDSGHDGTNFDFGRTLEPVAELLDAGVTVFRLSIPPGLPSMEDFDVFLEQLSAAVSGLQALR
jgi:probable F420-dependent oxidoreductase